MSSTPLVPNLSLLDVPSLYLFSSESSPSWMGGPYSSSHPYHTLNAESIDLRSAAGGAVMIFDFLNNHGFVSFQ